MFTWQQRGEIRSDLLQYAAQDRRISGAAITGSAAVESEDEWSDIDLAFGVSDDADRTEVMADWTAYMYEQHRAVHHMDMAAGAWIYRVFLLPGTLQVDLAFVSAAEFRPLAPTFRLVSGNAGEARYLPPQSPHDIIGFGWLYALHVRSCIARRQLWQAEYMVSGVRDCALALACLRHNLPAVHGRGMDRLPNDLIARFEGALVREIHAAELSRAFGVAVERLEDEIRFVDEELGSRLCGSLALLRQGVTQAGSTGK
jgi:hypothetical protein